MDRGEKIARETFEQRLKIIEMDLMQGQVFWVEEAERGASWGRFLEEAKCKLSTKGE